MKIYESSIFVLPLATLLKLFMREHDRPAYLATAVLIPQLAQICYISISVLKPGYTIPFFTYLSYQCDYVSITLLTFINPVHLQGDVVKDI